MKQKILLVEDDRDLAELTSNYLKYGFYELEGVRLTNG